MSEPTPENENVPPASETPSVNAEDSGATISLKIMVRKVFPHITITMPNTAFQINFGIDSTFSPCAMLIRYEMI